MAAPNNSAPPGYRLERKRSFTHFAIGVFGALAIIGVLAKIFRFQFELFGTSIGWEPFVLVGFIGEACVFIIMGMLKDFTYVPAEENAGKRGEEAPSSTHTDENSVVHGDIRSINEQDVADGIPLVRGGEDDRDVSLEETAVRMGSEAELLSREMEQTRRTLEQMRKEMEQALQRMQQFNEPEMSVNMHDSSQE